MKYIPGSDKRTQKCWKLHTFSFFAVLLTTLKFTTPLHYQTVSWKTVFCYINQFFFSFWSEASWYSKRPACAYGFNAKIWFEKYTMSPEILTKMCQNLGCQTKPAYFETFWPISQDSVHNFQKRFLHWNRGLKPIVLSTMKPIIRGIIFWTYKGAQEFLGARASLGLLNVKVKVKTAKKFGNSRTLPDL